MKGEKWAPSGAVRGLRPRHSSNVSPQMTLLEYFLDVQAELILYERGEVGAWRRRAQPSVAPFFHVSPRMDPA